MNKKCSKCAKTVYPTEELKCLDKVWHKACFKCTSCNMTLNMKNYKGYEKMPYCNAHYPTTKFTAVADTPESRRIAENTKIQSNVSYHADFERLKGKKTSVETDPETERIRYNTQIQSSVSYQGVREKKNEMEQKRPAENLEAGRLQHRQASKVNDYSQKDNVSSPYSAKQTSNVVYDSKAGQDEHQKPEYDEEIQNGMGRRQPGSIADYDPLNERFGSITGNYPAPPPQQQAFHQPPAQQPPPQQYVPPPQQQPPQRAADPYANKGMVCKAMYDYTAGDEDEVSFMDGDIIILCEPVDQGWMTGVVERTGQHGMLPSNYVERIN